MSFYFIFLIFFINEHFIYGIETISHIKRLVKKKQIKQVNTAIAKP